LVNNAIWDSGNQSWEKRTRQTSPRDKKKLQQGGGKSSFFEKERGDFEALKNRKNFFLGESQHEVERQAWGPTSCKTPSASKKKGRDKSTRENGKPQTSQRGGTDQFNPKTSKKKVIRNEPQKTPSRRKRTRLRT